MLRLKQIADITTVPDKFTYRFVQDGVVITSVSKQDWFEKIKKHAADNDYELPNDWKERAEDALCRRLSGEWCIGGTPHSFVNARFNFDDFVRGSKVVLTGKIVEPAVAEARALICSRCPVNLPVQGCGACSGIANLVATLKGARGTKQDHLLLACGVCHCPNESQVWYAAEDLAKGVTPEMMETYREIEYSSGCWKYAEINEISRT